MTDKRNYPDIDFLSKEETDTEMLKNALVKSYEIFVGRTLYPADPARLFILWIADIIIQERIIINETAKQNVPRYAKGENLDSISELYKDSTRLEAEPAHTTVRFYLSEIMTENRLIPKGTRTTVDGKIIFETIENISIEAGKLSGDVEAICQTVGTIGNGFVPGQIAQLIDVLPYCRKAENITESAGGAEKESDEAFYNRMRENMETFSTAGPMGGYEYFAKTASALIADIKATSPTPGNVDVRVLLQGGEIPGQEILQKVGETLNNDKIRPLTDYVTVSAPETIPYDIDVIYYTQYGGPINNETIASDVNAAVENYIKWQAGKMGRDINPSYLISLLMQAGIKRVEIKNPQYTEISESEVAINNSCKITYGGTENE